MKVDAFVGRSDTGLRMIPCDHLSAIALSVSGELAAPLPLRLSSLKRVLP
jgi:hypothetical protein